MLARVGGKVLSEPDAYSVFLEAPDLLVSSFQAQTRELAEIDTVDPSDVEDG